jgi:hypothetical protein
VFQVPTVRPHDRPALEGPPSTSQWVDWLARGGVPVMSLQEARTEVPGVRRSERTKAAIERARARGTVIGCPCGAKDTRKFRRSAYFAL